MMARRNITDRGERYRAQRNVTGPRRCVICGSRENLGVMHLDGNESHGEPANLAWGCKSCNGRLAAAFKRIGAGRPTNQYNPAAGQYPTFQQYAWAVSNHSRGAHDEGGAVIHATPKHLRIQYAKRIAQSKRSRGRMADDARWNPGAASENPFWDTTSTHYTRAPGGKFEDVAKHAGDTAAARRASLSAKKEERRRAAAEEKQRRRDRREADKLNRQFVRRAEQAERRKTTQQELADALQEKYTRAERKAASVPAKRRVSDKSILAELLRENPELEAWRRSNPSAFAKCVAAVQASGGAADPRAVCATAGRKKYGQAEMTRRAIAGKKKNPADAAAAAFEEFHGFPASQIVTVTKQIHRHEHLAAAGDLVGIAIKPVDRSKPVCVVHVDAALLCFNEAKNQLFVEGGDQSLPEKLLRRWFGITQIHEVETLGRSTAIDYGTDKKHLGAEGGTAVYEHAFRTTNENGLHVIVEIARYPDVIYRVLDEQIEFSGGSYYIRAEGIDQ